MIVREAIVSIYENIEMYFFKLILTGEYHFTTKGEILDLNK